MKILYILNNGMGNCVQMIPLYLSLKDAGYEVDVAYLKVYPTDSAKSVAVFPCNIIEEIGYSDISERDTHYDYVIKPPMIYSNKGDFIPEHILEMREMDSEVVRNSRIADTLKIPYAGRVELFTEWTDVPKEPYIVLHNGAQKGWEDKKYKYMQQLATRIHLEHGIKVVSIGGRNEYVFGTENYCGLPIRRTAHVIKESMVYIGTDTGTYHIAAALKKKGIAIFTKTSQGKNYDAVFHGSITPVQRLDLECVPCQRQYHWMIYGEQCKTRKCTEIPVETILERLNAHLR